MMELIQKNSVFAKLIIISTVINVCLLFALFYISVKTDICYKVLAKVGIVDYDKDEYRHQVEYRCIEGWANSLRKLQVNVDVVFYGNSITYESDFQGLFPQTRICNMGCNRDDLDDMIHRSFIIHSVRPSKIFILGGINGLMDITLEEFEAKYITLVDTIRKQNPSAQLYLQSILPVNTEMELGSRYVADVDKIKKVNLIIKQISESKHCNYVDLYSAYQCHDSLPRKYTRDGLHLNSDAYAVWARVIKPYVN